MPTYELWMPDPGRRKGYAFVVGERVQADDIETLTDGVRAYATSQGYPVMPRARVLHLPGVMDGVAMSLVFAVARSEEPAGSEISHVIANKLACAPGETEPIDLADTQPETRVPDGLRDGAK